MTRVWSTSHTHTNDAPTLVISFLANYLVPFLSTRLLAAMVILNRNYPTPRCRISLKMLVPAQLARHQTRYFYWKRTLHRLWMHRVPDEFNLRHYTLLCLRAIFLSSYLRFDLLAYRPKFQTHCHACHKYHPTHCVWFNHPNSIVCHVEHFPVTTEWHPPPKRR